MAESPQKYSLYILAGQSNMDGLGFVSELPDGLKGPQEEVFIFNPARKDDGEPLDERAMWEQLHPGHGYGYRTDGRISYPSDRFGPELTFARRIKELRPKQNIALFKYAKSGASIQPHNYDDWGCWDPGYDGINQWDHFEHHYRQAVGNDNSDGDGKREVLEPTAILWLQGESDAAYTREIAEAYEANLERVINRMRKLVGEPDLPAIICQIADSGMLEEGPALPMADIVQKAQRNFVKKDDHSRLIKIPSNHKRPDPWHFDSLTYLELGRRFADAVGRYVVG